MLAIAATTLRTTDIRHAVTFGISKWRKAYYKHIKNYKTMKKTLLSATCLLFGVVVYAQQPQKSDLENENIRGKVKSLTYESVPIYEESSSEDNIVYVDDEGISIATVASDWDDDNSYDSNIRSFTETFNTDGYMLEGEYKMSSDYTRTKTYDKNNNLIKDYFVEYEGEEAKETYYEYVIEKGVVTRESYYSFGTLYYESLYEYQNGDLVKETIINGEDGSVAMTYIYVWSADKRTKETMVMNNDDTMRSYKIEKFDDKGRVTESVKSADTYENGTIGFYSYDANGNIIKSFDAELDYYYSTSRLYDKEYDQYGNVVYEKGHVNGEYDATYFEYEYDETGNWTSKMCYDGEDKIPFRKITRTFEYYK